MSYKSIYSPATYEKVIEKSRFIANCAHVVNEEEAKIFLAKIRAEHSFATHNCYAYIADKTGNLMRFSDDGEPQGTAGIPILEVLKSKQLFETAVVVTRYFGGIKLGAGGLVRAYAGTASEALAQADIREYRMCRELKMKVGYENFDVLKKFLEKSGREIRKIEYTDTVIASVAVEESEEDHFIGALHDYMAGRVCTEKGKSDWIAFSCK